MVKLFNAGIFTVWIFSSILWWTDGQSFFHYHTLIWTIVMVGLSMMSIDFYKLKDALEVNDDE